mmetsp:Transcript_7350/g.13248  ORF Transcript_7350/g.13248 Transcript_7350/m.13248 type:complete len:822 (-) Transcript_7350:36-2501(-)
MTDQSDKNKPAQHAITDDVYLYTTRNPGPPVSFTYEVECCKFNRLKFTMDFQGSQNFELEGGGLLIDKLVAPFKRTMVGKLLLQDTSKGANLKNTYSWSLEDPDPAAVEQVLSEDKRKIGNELSRAKKLNFGDDSATINEIEKRCKANKVKFLDPDFPPTDSSLYAKDKSNEPVHDGKPVTWRRPTEFMSGSFDVFQGGIEPNDIRQGSLADCWFLCALSSLAEFPQLVMNLFEEQSKESSEAGVYKLRLCKNGQWQTVTVDDFFPCFPGAGPSYSRGHGNELWVLLLEKAYSKLHGAYAQIKMGWAYEAMIDLTGAPYMTIRFEDEDVQKTIKNGELWRNLVHWDQEGFIMSASTPGEDVFTESGEKPEKNGVGLVAGHAYTMLAAKQTMAGIRLCQLRNPWGGFEWQGDWGDTSDLWTDEIKEELNVVLAEDDGTFWMCFNDLLKHFFSINVCMADSSNNNNINWTEKRRKICFTFGADGNISTPMYIFSNKTTSKAYMSLHQEDQRCENALPYLDIGVSVLQILPDYTYKLMGSSGNSAERQNQTDVTLPPGQFLVVPTTTGCKFSQGLLGGNEGDAPKLFTKQNELTVQGEKALNEVFKRLDADLDGVLNKQELNAFMQMTEGCAMQDEVFDWIMQTFDSFEGGLTADGFRQCYMYMWEASGRDEETIWRDLIYMGYDRHLRLLFARTCILAIHSEGDFELHPQPFDADAYEEAMELPIKAFGKCAEYADGKAKLYTRKAGYSGVSFAVENNSSEPLEFTLDCSESKNVMSHRGTLVAVQIIPPKETKVMHHLMPKNAFVAWSWSYKASMSWIDSEE